MGRKIVFGVIILLFAVELLGMVAGHIGEPIRADLALAQLLVLVLPVRSVHPEGMRRYSAMLYRVISLPKKDGGRERKVQFFPKNFEPWDQ